MEQTRERLTTSDILARRDLAGMDLSGFSLGAADLRGKNFRGADLSHAHLGSADLSGADLRNTNLYKTNLGAANLTGADLRYADLREANLAGALTKGADFREAQGLSLEAPVDFHYLVRPVQLQETEDFADAKQHGYHPLTHWGREFALDTGTTLYKNQTVWLQLKRQLGDQIFGDRRIFSEVKLVQQYKEYSQWAYMISKKGFLRIAKTMNLKLQKKG
jgi:uncharacterized protein YjbI with pentapeptide repeats